MYKFEGSTPKGPKYSIPKKLLLAGWTCVPITSVVSGPKFTKSSSSNVGKVVVDDLLFRLSISPSIAEIFTNKPRSCPKSRPISHVFGPRFFGGRGREKFWDMDYKIEHTCDHVAKFHGDRPRELRDVAVKRRKETSAVKHKTVRNYRSGRPKYNTENTWSQSVHLPVLVNITTIQLLTIIYKHR